MSWILPNQILAMSSPSSYAMDSCLRPREYVPYFRKMKVGTIVRLNERMYNHSEFENNGVDVVEMEYPDGSNPPDHIIAQFIQLCDREISKGRAVAVHCRAGLGRTGTLIGLYMIWKFGCSVKSTIGWLRVCRPGSVVGE